MKLEFKRLLPDILKNITKLQILYNNSHNKKNLLHMGNYNKT